MNNSVVSAEALPSVIQALTTLAKELGLSVHFTVVETKPLPEVREDEDREQTLERHRREFIWLQGEIATADGSYPKFAGNYVAVYGERLIAISEDERTARAIAGARLKMDPKKILVVPICIPGSDSEENWRAIKGRLGIE